MKPVKVPINLPPYKNNDSATITELSDELIDGYVDENGCSNRRPGLARLLNLGTGTPVEGIYIWKKKDVALAHSGGRLFKIKDEHGTFLELTGDRLETSGFASFVNTGGTIFVANGGRIVFTDGTETTKYITDADAPVNVSKLGFLKGYILATIAGSGIVRFCEPFDYQNWPVLNFIKAEGSPDDIVNLIINNQEATLLGSDSVEPMYVQQVSDASDSPFAFYSGAYTERGVSAPESVTKLDNTIYFLDNQDMVSRLSGRSAQVVSTPFQKYISSFPKTSDAVGMDIACEGLSLFVLNFPTADKTLVFDYRLQTWSRWAFWDTTRAIYRRWLGNCSAKWTTKRLNLVGSRVDGMIYNLTSSAHQDDTAPIRLLRTTGSFDHGTYMHKICGSLTVRIRRGEGASDANPPVVMIRIKDNGALNWSNEIQGDLGRGEDREFFIRFEPMGEYISRQYEISVTDTVPVVIVGAEEMIEVSA